MIATIRTAKSRLSELIERAAAGEEIVITSHGRPKARLVGLAVDARPFRVNRSSLRRNRCKPGRPAETLVRDDRDGRG